MAATPFSHMQYSSISSLHFVDSERAALVGICQQIVNNARDLLHLDDCVVALLDSTGASFVPLVSARESLEGEPGVFPLHQGPLAALAHQQETLVLPGMRLDASLRPAAAEVSCSLACVPLYAQDQLLGALIASSSVQEAFPPERLQTLVLLAQQILMAFHNIHQAELVRDAQRMKANFLSLVTHELRSPLNTINGYLDLLLEGMAGEVNQQQQEFIRRARAGSEHLYALLEDLLLAARADAGQLRLNLAPVDLEELVASAIEELEVTALDSQVTLEADLPASLPPLLADSVRVQQVLRNLLINALRFTPAGGRVTVSARLLSACQEGGKERVEVWVRDSGIGIAPEYHQRIFERFFQVPRREGGRTSGQGLGLTIVKLIVELHGGQVRVESALDQGSTFLFTLETLPDQSPLARNAAVS